MSRATIRLYQPKDFTNVLEVEENAYKSPWKPEDILALTRDPRGWTLVADRRGEVVGFAMLMIEPRCFRLLNIAVHRDYQRCGYGRGMVDTVFSHVSRRHVSIVTDVRETALGAQLFFRSTGFRAVPPILKGQFRNSTEDCYRFERRHSWQKFDPKNRIASYIGGTSL